jgi:hypothetical protein
MQMQISYDRATDTLTGLAHVRSPQGVTFPVTAEVRGVRALAELLARHYLAAARAQAEAAGDEVGFFGWAKKAWKKVTQKAWQVAKAVKVAGILKKVKSAAQTAVKTARKIYEHPAFAAAVGVVSAAVPGGATLAAGYAASRAALTLFDKMRKGDKAALATVGKYAAQAVQGDAGAQKVMALMQSVRPENVPVPAAQNPWLQGLGALTQGVAALAA